MTTANRLQVGRSSRRRIFSKVVCVVTLLVLREPHAATAWAQPTPAILSEVDKYVEARRSAGRIPGVALAIVQGDRVVYCRGYGTADEAGRPVDGQTVFGLGSLSKAFTGLALMQLVESTRVELDQPVRKYLPWFRAGDDDAASQAISVRHLMDQTSGLSTYAGRLLLTDQDDSDQALEKRVRALASLSLSSRPGTQYEYSNANYNTAGLIIQSVTGQPFETYIREQIFVPLEMRHSFTSLQDAEQGGLATGHRFWFYHPVAMSRSPFARGELPAQWLCSSADDMAHWMIAHLNDGQYHGRSILSPAAMRQLHQPPAGGWYSMGWGQHGLGESTIWTHYGDTPNFHAEIVLLPSARLGIVTLCNANTFVDQQSIHNLAYGVLSIVRGQQPSEAGHDPKAAKIYFALAGLAAFLIVTSSFSLWTWRRWKRAPQRMPQGNWAWVRHLAFPVALSIAVITILLVVIPAQFQTPLAGILQNQPDAGWVCVLCAFWCAMGNHSSCHRHPAIAGENKALGAVIKRPAPRINATGSGDKNPGVDRSNHSQAVRRARMLWLRTVLFTILVPGTELVLLPLVVVFLGLGPRIELGSARYSGVAPLLVGLVMILRCFADFVRHGRGTPAPYDPPRELVVAGLYRYVRNPQYVGVVLVVVGEALLSGMVVLVGYAAVLAIGYHFFVTHYEEPTLEQLFGEPYARYREAVPRWLPRRPGR